MNTIRKTNNNKYKKDNIGYDLKIQKFFRIEFRDYASSWMMGVRWLELLDSQVVDMGQLRCLEEDKAQLYHHMVQA